jgi:hypothetical protein
VGYHIQRSSVVPQDLQLWDSRVWSKASRFWEYRQTGQFPSLHLVRHWQWKVCWQRMVRRPVTLASIRSRQTGHVGSSRRAGVGGGAGRLESVGEDAFGGRNGSSINGEIVSR